MLTESLPEFHVTNIILFPGWNKSFAANLISDMTRKSELATRGDWE